MQVESGVDRIRRRPVVRGAPDVGAHQKVANGWKWSVIFGRLQKTIEPLKILAGDVELRFRSEVHSSKDLLADRAVVPWTQDQLLDRKSVV